MSLPELKPFLRVLEVLELIKLMKTAIPVLIFLLNFIIGGMVASGRVTPACQNDVLNAFIDIGGYLILVGTSIASLIHALRHGRTTTTTTTTQPVVTETVKTVVDPAPETPTNEIAPPPGTPPPGLSIK